MAWDNLSEATKKQLRDQIAHYLGERFRVNPSEELIEGTTQVLLMKVVAVLEVPVKKKSVAPAPKNLTELGLLFYRDQMRHHLADIETEFCRVQREVADDILSAFGIGTELARTVISEVIDKIKERERATKS